MTTIVRVNERSHAIDLISLINQLTLICLGKNGPRNYWEAEQRDEST